MIWGRQRVTLNNRAIIIIVLIYHLNQALSIHHFLFVSLLLLIPQFTHKHSCHAIIIITSSDLCNYHTFLCLFRIWNLGTAPSRQPVPWAIQNTTSPLPLHEHGAPSANSSSVLYSIQPLSFLSSLRALLFIFIWCYTILIQQLHYIKQ